MFNFSSINCINSSFFTKFQYLRNIYHYLKYSSFTRCISPSTDRYPLIKRGPYKNLTNEDIIYFNNLSVDSSLVVNNPDDLDVYNEDILKQFKGQSRLVLKPKTTDDISRIVSYCNNNKIAICTQGGNTGLVGGSTPLFDEIILSTKLMNNIINVDATAGLLVCQSGCILEVLNEHLSKYKLMMPIDLGSKGSCNIGGNISTNAGGKRLLRYGSLQGNVIGLEVVKGDGTILDCLSTVRKDNVGYHLKNLFIGSEGTLGIITKVSMLVSRLPSSINVAFLSCNSFEKVLQILNQARESLEEILSAYEFMDSQAIEVSESSMNSKIPFKEPASFYVLVETSGSVAKHDEEKLSLFLENVMSKGLVIDGLLATDSNRIKHLWKFRESITMGLLEDGCCYKYDISLPLNKYYEIVEIIREKFKGLVTRTCSYGHVGDG